MKARLIVMTLAAGAGLAGAANAADVLVTTDISVSTTWTANNVYNLQAQIYVLPGATLTIEPGTVIASTSNLGGSLAVCKGAQIFVNGTQSSPVVMTSQADVATWTGGDPKTGTWRAACNEWGNLTVMGAGYISANNHGGATTNVPAPNGNNVAPMEGLVAAFPGDTKVLYGGGNDDDDSGSITYLSLRYGGKVIGLGNELNGLSMGGIGRNTEVNHIDIMNNVDDGIETWGGTVNYKYLNIWNVGDDSFDVDEGWRGKAQFGLLVEGYSVVAATGSGVGDHNFEVDGAEDSDWQPVTTAAIYNFTCIHQPLNPRGQVDWRDNARVQYRNCIFMDAGGEVVKFDNTDGDGAHGYGFNGTLSWPATWTTAYNAVPATANDAPPGLTGWAGYSVQADGFLAEIRDSVFFRNLNANAYVEATARGVFDPAMNNVQTPGSLPADAPILSITRGAPVAAPGYQVLPVIGLDPRPANAALTSIGSAPNDGFFTPAQYRGAFAPNAPSWLCGWTASSAFGYTTDCGEALVTNDIATSTTWTADVTYNLQKQIYVLPGATLTIEPGTVIASSTSVGGSLAVCKGAQIFVNGTQSNPVVMTSQADVATWTGGDPKTGTWRAACNEWGNLTVMGAGYISANNHGGATTNVPAPNGNNVAPMEGLVAAFPGDTKVLYGGGNDDDDSGSITYLSLRYGGKVIGLGNELNGLSMGGIGRNTEVNHIDIMNNVDDGIETWGGTVNYKYLNIWNVGDDSFDVDEGWRGKAQFGLLVEGYSVVAATGSGVGDHNFEVDGAEDSDWQPVTTAAIYNFTCIHQPLNPRGQVDWRDNARVQYRNCIFMDAGGEVVKFDNTDGDGAHGYGFNGTLSWPATWTTAYNAVPATANDAPPGLSGWAGYSVQTDGFLAEVSDSVFFRNLNAVAYTEATARGVFDPAMNNVLTPGSLPADAPILSITRGAAVAAPGYQVLPVIGLDPRPANAALTSVGSAPNDGFFTSAQYRGAFAPNAQSWLCGWTASYAFGYTTECDPGVPFCIPGVDGVQGCPCGNPGITGRGCNNSSATGGAVMTATGLASVAADSVVLTSSFEKPAAPTVFLQGSALASTGFVFGQGIRCAGGSIKRMYIHLASGGVVSAPAGSDAHITTRSAALGSVITPGSTRWYQAWYRDPTVLGGCPILSGYNASSGQAIIWGP